MKHQTRLAHVGRPTREEWPAPVNTPAYRASTVVFPDLASYRAVFSAPYGTLAYGRDGTPTIFAFEEAIAELEGGYAALAMPSGMAAIACALFACLKAGDHVLLPDSMYGTARTLCENQFPRSGIEHSYYDPRAGADISNELRPNTRVVYTESPGSVTFEVQDIPAIVNAAHDSGAIVIMDNTWATPLLFPAIRKGVDISIHAATKYIVGHSDAMLGVLVSNEQCFSSLRRIQADLGYVAGSEEAYLGLRGLRTLGLRLSQHQQSALMLARYLRARPEVEDVLYPALPGAAGHALWKRDFEGASGVFSVVLRPEFDRFVETFVDALRLFAIGASWGGFESLVTVHRPEKHRLLSCWQGKTLLRFHIGLEDPSDLTDDVDRAFKLATSKIVNVAIE